MSDNGVYAGQRRIRGGVTGSLSPAVTARVAADVRRIVDGLRPPTLDELGLAPALPPGTRIIARLPAGFSRADRDASPMTARQPPPDAEPARLSSRGS